MRSKTSPTPSLTWSSPLSDLLKSKKPSPTLEKLEAGGVSKLSDLLWLLPLRIYPMPKELPFRDAHLGAPFRGRGKIIHTEIRPAFGRRGKGNILLYNGFVIVRDTHSSETLSLRWFNLYPNQKKQIEALDEIQFLGEPQEYKAQKQIINPQISSPNDAESAGYIAEYPTINKVSGTHIRKLINLIPSELWEEIPQTLPELGYNKDYSLSEAFKTIHGQIPVERFSPPLKGQAIERLIYEEFLIDQVKIHVRRKLTKRKIAKKYSIKSSVVKSITGALPFSLTQDQEKVLDDIQKDLNSGHPMMRMVQGDVGSGKTIVAYLASRVIMDNGSQVAFMCPTETLATQHFQTFQELCPEIPMDLLLGSTKAKEKKAILARLLSGDTRLVIGTHSLFQDSVLFKDLGLAIIDEQHKFGVDQRLRLVGKGEATHSLIMTATPIPRTLSLAQYGDLDLSFIRMMPAGRKGIKTRITEPVNYGKYVNFVKGRLRLGEQAYFVFPAIDESEVLDLQNVKTSLEKYRKTFPEFRVEALHGQLKHDDKQSVVDEFKAGKTQILISTSVIEVGINISNATIMSIYNPERFGLSSLHQLRGRVGRGDKPGFCFLVLDKEIGPEGMERLKVVEDNIDGFIIAEEDLKFRGEGDLFGVDQSGSTTSKKLANFITHSHILEKVVRDLEALEKSSPNLLAPLIKKYSQDERITLLV
jgi:ATP-dependent DNA helicase RecG